MTATFIHQGDAIDHVPATDLAAGAVVAQADLVGVATRSIPAGHLGALQLRGVFDFPRLSGGVIGVGFRLYWDDTAQVATTNDGSGANPYLGKAVREADDLDTIVRIRLEQ
jgi:predicted RecA/RadA family phage recombinase